MLGSAKSEKGLTSPLGRVETESPTILMEGHAEPMQSKSEAKSAQGMNRTRKVKNLIFQEAMVFSFMMPNVEVSGAPLAARPLQRMVERLISEAPISSLDSGLHRMKIDRSFHRGRRHGIPRRAP